MSKPFIAVPHYRQELSYSCLPACVRMILTFWKAEHTERELRVLFKTRMGGTSPAQVMLELPRLGFSAAVWRGSLEALRSFVAQGTPCIVSLWTGELTYWAEETMHTVVVVGMDEDTLWVNDPSVPDAPQQIPGDEFAVAWSLADRVMIVIRSLDDPSTDSVRR